MGWLFLLAPFLMIFAFGWVINRGTLQQVQGVFWGFSAVMGISLAPIFLTYTGDSITRLFLITAATFGGMSIYGYTTKRDLTAMGSFMVMGLWGVIIASSVNIFMQSSGLSFALSILTVIIFTGLTAYDTQKIRSLYLSADTGDTLSRKAIAGALELYLDFINPVPGSAQTFRRPPLKNKVFSGSVHTGSFFLQKFIDLPPKNVYKQNYPRP